MPLSPKWYQFLVGVFASLGSVLFGYDLGVIAGCIQAPSFLSLFNNPDPNELGAVVSLFTGGAFFGAMFAGPTADFLGRRLTILIGSVVFLLGGALQTGAQTIDFLYSGRAIAGAGVGFLVMIVPLYQAEIAHPSIRGRITGLQQFMIGIGATVATWTTYGTTKNFADNDSAEWRVPLGIQLVPAGVLGLLIFLFPESPRWLLAKGRDTAGLQNLAKLHAHGDTNDAWVRSEYEQIKESIAFDEAHEVKGYRDLFRVRSNFRRLLLATSLQASVQMTGVSAIQYFSPVIYKTLDIGLTDALKYQAISNVLSVVAQLCTILFVDALGRRWLLIAGNLVNCVCFTIITAAVATFASASDSGQHARGWVFIVINWVYQISFSFTCGSLSWIIPAEIFDTATRSKGVSIGVMVSFGFNTMIGQVTAPAIANIGWKYYLVFVVCNFVNAVWFWGLMPETAKRPLEEMNRLFTEAPWFVPGMDGKALASRDLENRVQEKEGKVVFDEVAVEKVSKA